MSLRRMLRGCYTVSSLVGVVVLAAAGGCTQLLLTSAYLIKGVETPGEFTELKGKKAVVVCRPLVELQYSSSGAAELLSRNVAALMQQKIRRIELTSPQRVEQWTDEHEWEEFPQVGKAFKSDYVIGVEIEDFNLYSGQTIYQGRARVHVTVHDMQKKGELVYEKTLPEIVYPPSGIPTSEKPEEEFRRQFTGIVAEQIGRLFYGYDHRDDVALDSAILK